MVSLNHSRYLLPKSPGWMRAVQIGFGALTIVTSIFALVFPGSAYISVVWVFAIGTVLRWNRRNHRRNFFT